MRKKNLLALRREVVAELSAADLSAVAGAGVTNTCFSCLDYISCNPAQCWAEDTLICPA